MRTGTVAAMMLALLCAGPAQAQTQRRVLPQLPPGAVEKIKEIEARCDDLNAPYKGGMLSGKIAFVGETTTQAMMANETVPTAPEARQLRGYMVAMRKCETLQHEFIAANAPWDLSAADYIASNQQPVYEALAARKITYGVANRRLYDIAATAHEMREKNWPQVAQTQIDDARSAALRAAKQDVDARCRARFVPFHNSILQGKIAFGGEEISPAMRIYEAIPNEAEAGMLRQLLAARDACWSDLIAFARQYDTPWLAQSQAEQAAEHLVFEDLIAGKISFAEGNRRLAAIRAQAERPAARVDTPDAASTYLRP
jgi:hypothetical protein